MELSLFAINEITPYIFGKDGAAKNRTSKELVNLFNKYGFRDVITDGKLPKIDTKKEFNTTRTEYTRDRLSQMIGSNRLRELLEEVLNDQDGTENCKEAFLRILAPENYDIVESDGRISIIGGIIKKNDEVKNEAKFRNIQNSILKELDKCRVSISLAMAWFTNEILRDKLKEKAEQGISIEIVIYDDHVNKKGVDLTGFNVTRVRGQRGGIMHNKFCVIDNQVVIHGSYNWSNNAEFRNDESIEISYDNKLASDFSVQFRELKNPKNK